MKKAPRITVLSMYPECELAVQRRSENLARQTYREVNLVWISGNERVASEKVLAKTQMLSYLQNSDDELIFLWPELVDLQPATLEKLVLALHLAPACDGLTDLACGKNGWLLRRSEKIFPWISAWLDREENWLEAKFYHLKEDLADSPSLRLEKDEPSSQKINRELPVLFENYQQIPVEPIGPLPTELPDERSLLIVVSSLPMGGACKYTLDLVTQLVGRGYRVMIATTAYYPNPWLDQFLAVIPNVFILPHLASGIEFPRLLVHLARSRRCGKILISHSMLGYQLLPYLRSALPEVTFLDYTHIEYESEWPNGGYAQLSVNRQPLLDRVLVSSEHLRRWMIDQGAEGERIQVCPTNIDCKKWAPCSSARARDRRDLGIDEKAVFILYACRIAEQKRPALLCNVIAALREITTVPFVVVVAGDGPLMMPLRKFVEDHHLEKYFRLLGAVPLPRMASLHNAADVFFLPSQIEGISLALFEAMALESVPVVSDVGGQRELVTPDCGYLLPLGEEKTELAAYIRVLVELLENPRLRRQKSAACRRRVQQYFSLEQMTDIFVEAMEQAGQRHRQHPPALPAASVCRDLATLAIDHVRVGYEGQGLQERYFDLQELAAKQKKVIAKLQQRFALDVTGTEALR